MRELWARNYTAIAIKNNHFYGFLASFEDKYSMKIGVLSSDSSYRNNDTTWLRNQHICGRYKTPRHWRKVGSVVNRVPASLWGIHCRAALESKYRIAHALLTGVRDFIPAGRVDSLETARLHEKKLAADNVLFSTQTAPNPWGIIFLTLLNCL